MTSSFPFVVTDMQDLATPERQQQILVDLSDLDDYYTLFEKHGFGGGGASWVEHIETILEESDPELLDHVEFDDEGETFIAYTDGPAATDQFLQRLVPIFSDLGALNKYLSQTDPADFFE